MNRIIRYATVADIPYVTAIYNHYAKTSVMCFDAEPINEEFFEGFIKPSPFRHLLLVCEDSEKVQGFAGLYPFSKRQTYSPMSELTCYIAPDAIREGIGFELCQSVVNFAPTLDCSCILSLVNANNKAMRNLMSRLQFDYRGTLIDVAEKFGQKQSMACYQKKTIE